MARKALASLCIIFACVTAAHSQARQGPNAPSAISVRGRIMMEAGQPEGLEVTLERAEMQTIATTFSDSIGNFEFRNLIPASYYVVIKASGYEDVRQLVPYGPSTAGAPVYVFLNKEPFKVVAIHRAPVVDVAELNRNYPKRALEEYEAAQEESRKGNTSKAAEHLELAVSLAPDFYSAHNGLGIAYQKLQRYRDAEKEFNQARELNARSVDPLVNLGSMFIQEAEDSSVT